MNKVDEKSCQSCYWTLDKSLYAPRNRGFSRSLPQDVGRLKARFPNCPKSNKVDRRFFPCYTAPRLRLIILCVKEGDLKRRWLILFTLVVLACGRVPAAVADDPPAGLAMEAEAAFDGTFKYGEWLPVWVLLENTGQDLEAELRVRVTGSGGATTFAAPAPLPTGSRKRIPVYVLPNNFSHELEVQLVEGKDVLVAQKIPVEPRPNYSYFAGLITPERGALSLLLGVSLPGQERPKEFIDLSLADLPERVEGLRSFDCLFLNDVDTSTLSPEQGAALEGWVQQGGRLVIGGGAGAMRTVAGLPESLLPFEPHSLVEVDSLPELASFAGAEAIRVPGPFVVATGEAVEGRTLAAQNDLPLVRERSVGGGYVDFVALDLAVSPFDAWTGTTAFWEKLLSPGAVYPEWLPPDMSARQMQSSQMGYALSQLPSLDLPSIRGLGLLLVLYVVLVGPVNYLVLRWRKQLHWAWITIPIITVAFSAGAFGLGYAMRGTDLILNKIAIVALRPGGIADTISYLGLFSPAQQSYEIDIPDSGLLSPLNVGYDSWGRGGLSTAGETVFLQSEPSRVRGLAVNQWSMQTLMTESVWADFGEVVGDLRIEGDGLVGTVRNETAHTLTDVTLILGSYFVRLGDLAPGAEAPVTMELVDLSNQRFGPDISWRLFEDQFSGVGPTGPPREAELKRTVVSSIFQSSGGFGPNGVRWAGEGGSPQSLILLGWLDKAPPDVQVAGREPAQQTTALCYAPLSFHLPEEGEISLPPGFIHGTLIEMPVEGGPCGPDMGSLWLGRGQATFEFQMPDDVRDMQVRELKLVLGSDGGWWQPPGTEIYDWSAAAWVGLDEPVMGVNVFSDATGLVSEDGLVRVRLSSEGNNRGGGCMYVDMGLEGTR